MKIKIVLVFLCFSIYLNAQENKEIVNQIEILYKEALTNGKSYNWLDRLSNQIGVRLSGSLNAERAIQ